MPRKAVTTELPLDLSDSTGVSVARSIIWAAEHISQTRITQKEAGSALNYAYWQYGKKNRTELLVQLVPKALSIIDKNKTPQENADVAAAEKASIAELEELLEGALEEFEESQKPAGRKKPAKPVDALSDMGF
jgi:hypothetical protein